MSRLVSSCALIIPLSITLAGCASSPAATPSWNKYYVAGSRIARTLDPQGQPLTGSHIVTITDEDLQNSGGVLLGEKLAGGYPR